ncbi:MAG: right-handed parallel beta-helix repeat-containing protein, partial [bacterium]
ISPNILKSGDLLTINGENFGSTQGAGQVLFGTTTAANYQNWNDTQIRVYVPSIYSNTCGTAQVMVRVDTKESNTKPLTIDNSKPTVTISFPAEGAKICKDKQNITISGIASDQCSAISKIEVRIDAGPWLTVSGTASWNYNWNIGSASEGNHSISVRATDQLNNISPILSRTVQITTDPSICEVTDIIYVDKTATGSGTGASWEDAFTAIQEGIDLAAAQDIKEIWVAHGSYNENIVLAEGISLYGGFNGTETDLDQRDHQSYVTTIDGRHLGITVIGAHNTIIDGFSIANGSSDWGSGIYCPANADMSLYNNYIHHNKANVSGGGIYLGNQSNTEIIGNTFQYNEALYGGGIIADNTLSCKIRENTIIENTAIFKDANQTEGGWGAGVYLNNASVEISDNTITQNIADYEGGGIYTWSGDIVIINNEIGNNEASWAGGIAESSSSLIQNNHIHHNHASNAGGGIYIEDEAAPSLIRNLIESNSANSGGGIFAEQGSAPLIESNRMIGNEVKMDAGVGGGGGAIDLSMVNSARIFKNLILNNKADWGGGILVWGGSNIEIRNNVIGKNMVINNGGAIYFDGGASCLLVNNTFFKNTSEINGSCFSVWKTNTIVDVMNCIIYPSTLQSPIILDTVPPSFNITYTDTYGWDEPGAGNINQDPRFIDPNTGNFRLRDDSPCIDAGNPDQQYNDIDGSRNDMGACGGADPICLESFIAFIRATGQEIGNAVRVSQVTIGIENVAQTKSPAPPPPDYTVYMRLVDPDSSNTYYGKDIRGCGTTEDIWPLRVQIGEKADPQKGGYYPELIWEPNSLSTTGNFFLWAGTPGGPATKLVDMRQADHYQIKQEDGEYFYIQFSNTTTATIELPAGWSMISLPVLPGNCSVFALFPEAEVVYGFDPYWGYFEAEELNKGEGYWILLHESHTYNLEGQPIMDYNLEVQNGWYMIGGCTGMAQASVDKGIIEVVYGFDNQYGYVEVQPDNLKPTEGYWISLLDMSGQGNLSVHSTGASSTPRMKISTENSILYIKAKGQEKDNAIRVSTIALGPAQTAERKSPAPLPPSYTVRMRINYIEENSYYGKDLRQAGSFQQVWVIRVDINDEVADPGKSGYYPTLSWDSQSIQPGEMKLVLGATEDGQALVEDMSQVNSYETKPADGSAPTLYYSIIYSPDIPSESDNSSAADNPSSLDTPSAPDPSADMNETTLSSQSLILDNTGVYNLYGSNYAPYIYNPDFYMLQNNPYVLFHSGIPTWFLINGQNTGNKESSAGYPYGSPYNGLTQSGIGGFVYQPFYYEGTWFIRINGFHFGPPFYFSEGGLGYLLTGFGSGSYPEINSYSYNILF